MIILGLNAYHADASACLVVDGQLVAAAEEERFCRVKHWAGLPARAVSACLNQAGLEASAIDRIAVNRNPSTNLLKKAAYAFAKRPGLGAIRDRLANACKVRDVRGEVESKLGLAKGILKAPLHSVEHHRAHLASAFLVSPFESAAVASVDGFGDFVSSMIGDRKSTRLNSSHVKISYAVFCLKKNKRRDLPSKAT